MATKTLIYVGPFAAGVGIDTGQWLEPGDPVEVDEDVAGHAPEGDDLGAGLLAQTANFIEADMTAATVAKVLDSVGDDPERAAAALAAEQLRDKPRKSLIDRLEAIIAEGEEDESNG